MAGLSGKSNSLQAKVLMNLRSIFNVAMENGLVAKSPDSTTLKPTGKATQEKETLAADEREVLLDRVKNILARMFLLIGLYTGMRRSEIPGLQWKVIHVRHNAVGKEGETKVSEEMKTKAAKRNLPLSEELEEWLSERKKSSHSQYVIAMEGHKPLTKSSYRSMWKLIERELPDRHITAHILRHTHIIRPFEAGLDIKEIPYLAGHSTIDMTLKVYTHYDRRSGEAKTAEKVREALRASA